MENVMGLLADEIALGLTKELQRRKTAPAPHPERAYEMLGDEVVRELVSRQDMVQTSEFSERQDLSQRLERVEKKLEKIAARIRSEQAEPRVQSNRGGDASKYQNVDTLLKYVDGAGLESGVKLVIMNFND